jgi:SAM-dependent methyltransferase
MELKEIIPWGRTFEEYRLIFNLSPEDLGGRILGCGDGPASFNAEATTRGHTVISCDPVYEFSAEQIAERVNACYDNVITQVRRHQDGFVWGYFRDPDDLGQRRLMAMDRFLGDYDVGKAAGRYITAALPDLPFANGQFDLAVVSHLLFLYSGHLGFEFHVQSVNELLRVSQEVRIFPLLTLERHQSPHLEPLRAHLTEAGVTNEIRRVDYEFQRGGNQMLVIKR